MNNDIQNLWDDIKWCRQQLNKMTIDHALCGLGIADNSERVAQLEGFIAGALDRNRTHDHKYGGQICNRVMRSFRNAWPDVQSIWAEAPKTWMVAAIKTCIKQIDQGTALPRKAQDATSGGPVCVHCQASNANRWDFSGESHTYTANGQDQHVEETPINLAPATHKDPVVANWGQGGWGQELYGQDEQDMSAWADHHYPCGPNSRAVYPEYQGCNDIRGAGNRTYDSGGNAWGGMGSPDINVSKPGRDIRSWGVDESAPKTSVNDPHTPTRMAGWIGGRPQPPPVAVRFRPLPVDDDTMRHVFSVSPPLQNGATYAHDSTADPFGSQAPNELNNLFSEPSPLPRPRDPILTRKRTQLRWRSRSRATSSDEIQVDFLPGKGMRSLGIRRDQQDDTQTSIGGTVNNSGGGNIWPPYASSSIRADKSVADNDSVLDGEVHAIDELDMLDKWISSRRQSPTTQGCGLGGW